MPKIQPNPFFVKLNIKLFPWKKCIPKIGLFCDLKQVAQKKTIAQSGHPGFIPNLSWWQKKGPCLPLFRGCKSG
jgi:hypothetical protein